MNTLHRLHDAAGKALTRIACRLAAIVIRIGMNDQCSAADAISLAVECDHAVKHLRSQNAILINILVGHVAGMGSHCGQQPVLGIGRIEVLSG